MYPHADDDEGPHTHTILPVDVPKDKSGYVHPEWESELEGCVSEGSAPEMQEREDRGAVEVAASEWAENWFGKADHKLVSLVQACSSVGPELEEASRGEAVAVRGEAVT